MSETATTQASDPFDLGQGTQPAQAKPAQQAKGPAPDDPFDLGGPAGPVTPEQPGMLRRAGSALVEGLPVVGPAISAYKDGLTPADTRAVGNVADVTSALHNPLSKEDPAEMKADFDTLRKQINDPTNPTAGNFPNYSPYTTRRAAHMNAVVQSPIGRAIVAGAIDLPIQFAEGLGASIPARAIERQMLKKGGEVVAEGLSNSGLTAAKEASKRAAQIAARAHLTEQAVGGATYGEADVLRRRMEGEEIPVSAYVTSPIYGAIFSVALGQGLEKLGDARAKRMTPAMSEIVKADPQAVFHIKAVQDIVRKTAEANKIPIPEAASTAYKVLTGTANATERQSLAKVLIAHPELQKTEMGQFLMQSVRAATKPTIIGDASLPAGDPTEITFEDSSRSEHTVVAHTPDDIKSLTARAKRNEIRIIRAYGPQETTRLIDRAVTLVDKATYHPPTMEAPNWDEIDGLLASHKGRIPAYFQGMKNVDPPSTALTIAGPLSDESTRGLTERQIKFAQRDLAAKPTTYPSTERVIPGGPATAVGPNQSFIMRTGEMTDAEREASLARTGRRFEPQAVHPAEAFAANANKLITELKGDGFVDMNSELAVAAHHHPQIKPGEGNEVPTIVPATTAKMTVTKNTGTVKGPDAPVKPSPEVRDAKLAGGSPNGTPNEVAYPVRGDFLKDLSDLVTQPGKLKKNATIPVSPLDELIDHRTSGGGRKFQGYVQQAFALSPDDPRLTPESARSALAIMEAHIEDLETAAEKRGETDLSSNDDLTKLDKFDRFSHIWRRRAGVPAEFHESYPVRGSIGAPGQPIIPVTNIGHGELSLDTGFGNVTKVEAKDFPSLAEAAKPLSEEDVRAAATKPTGARPLQYRSHAELSKRRGVVSSALEASRVSANDARTADLTEQLARIDEALRVKVGTETIAQTPVPEHVEPPKVDKLDALRKRAAALEKLLKGKSKGAITGKPYHPQYGTLLTNRFANFAKDLGHGRSFIDDEGKITVETKVDGKTIPVTYPDELSASAGLASLGNERAEMSRQGATIERAIASDKIPPLPVSSLEGSGSIAFDHAVGLNLPPEQVEPRARMADIDPFGILHDGKAFLESRGKNGQNLSFLSEQYMDGVQTWRGRIDAAVSQFDREVGSKTGYNDLRETEGRKGRVDIYSKTMRQVLNQQYADAQAVGAPVAPLIQDTASQIYIPHRVALSTLTKQIGGKPTNAFLDSMISAGLADSRDSAWQRFIETGGWLHVDRERTVAEMVEKVNARNKSLGKPAISKTEAERQLDLFSAKAQAIAPSLQYDREGSLNYDNDLRATFKAVAMRNARMIEEYRVFGTRNERLNASIDGIRKQFSSVDAEQALGLVDMIRGRNYGAHEGLRDTVMGSAINFDRTYLTMSALYHIPQNFFVGSRFGWGNFFKSMPEFISRMSTPEGREQFIRAGAALKRSMDTMHQGVLNEAPSRFEKVARYIGDKAAALLEHTINFSRKFASVVGEDAFTRFHDKLKLGDNPKVLADLNELMNRPGTTREAWLGLKGRELAVAREQAGMRAANWAFFRFDSLTQPMAMSTGGNLAKIILQFKSFLYPYTRLVYHELFKETGARQARMWLTMLAGMPAYGYAQSKLREFIGAGTKSTKATVKAVNELYKHDDRFANYINAYVQGITAIHAAGWFSGIIDAFDTGNGQNLLSLGGDVPAISWLASIPLALTSAGRGAYNWSEGHKALARYDFQKATEQAGHMFGGLGVALAHHTVGAPKKPKKAPRL